MTTWKDVWKKKGATVLPAGEDEKLQAMMAINGATTALGGISLDELKNTAGRILTLLDLTSQDRLLDVGCGCGAVLYAMQDRPAHIVGVDYSATSIGLAKQVLTGEFLCCEAIDFPFEPNSFDGVFSLGVFIYFPDCDYAAQVIRNMVSALKPGKRGLIIDAMDVDLKEERERRRRETLTPEVYERDYADLPHLYLAREWMMETLNELGCHAEFVEFFGEAYGYKRHAFHVLFTKNI